MRRLIIFFSLLHKLGTAQTITADFSVSTPVCLDQSISISNTSSTNATNFVWDFCLTDIATTPTIGLLGMANSISNLGAIEVVNDNQLWYGFIPGRGDNHLYRLDFGGSLYNLITVVDLGNVGGAL